MPLGLVTLVRLILEGIVEWLKLQILKMQYDLKMALIDRKERYEDEAERKQVEIDDLRAAGRHDYADVLYDQQLRRAEFLVDLPAAPIKPPEGPEGTNT